MSATIEIAVCAVFRGFNSGMGVCSSVPSGMVFSLAAFKVDSP